MINFKYLVALLPSLALAQPNTFVTGGVDATIDDYKDYMVAFDIGWGTKCGGTLINGKWILTARHCTPLWPDNNFTPTTRLKVYQGLSYYDEDDVVFNGAAVKYHEWSFQAHHDYRDEVINNKVAPLVRDIMRTDDFSHLTEIVFHGSMSETLHDIVLIELPIAIEHEDSVIFERPEVLNDNFAPTTLVELEAGLGVDVDRTFTFMGWGIDMENSQLPSQLQKYQALTTRRPLYLDCKITGITTEGAQIEGGCHLDTHTPEYRFNSLFLVLTSDFDVATTGVLPHTSIGQGDSGTGLYADDNTIYGVSSRVSRAPDAEGNYRSSFNATQWYSNWFAQTLNGLSTASALIQVETAEGVYLPEDTVTVQNMSLDTHVIAPVVTDTSFFFLTENRCPDQLAPFESCEIDIRGNENGDFLTYGDSYASTLQINTETEIPLLMTVEEEITEPDTPETPELPDSGSKGGSTSLYMLAALALIARLRAFSK